MHKLITPAAMALGACLALAAWSAQATVINVPLSGCAGHPSCTSDGVTLSGWEYKTKAGVWAPVYMTYKAHGPDETGLGLNCAYGKGDKCGQDEINTMPPQYIAADISGIKFTGLSIGVASVDNGGCGNKPCSSPDEEAIIYGSACANLSICGVAVPLASYTFNGTDETWTFNFSAAFLSGYSFLYVTPLGGPAPDSNILLASLSYSVPEPGVLGMFGLGVLLIGLFAGLHRRMR